MPLIRSWRTNLLLTSWLWTTTCILSRYRRKRAPDSEALPTHRPHSPEVSGTNIAAQLHAREFAGMVVICTASNGLQMQGGVGISPPTLPMGVFRVINKGGLTILHYELTKAWQAWALHGV